MQLTYIDLFVPSNVSSSREFETAMAAMNHDDNNPMRQMLGLDLKGFCEDCDVEEIMVPHGKSLLCLACHAEREAFLAEVTAPKDVLAEYRTEENKEAWDAAYWRRFATWRDELMNGDAEATK